MDMTKGQGAQAEEMTLSALLKMLELSKFLTVEVMCEQYLASHAEEGMAYLIMYAAKVKSATLHKFQKGDSVSCDFQETFPLYIEHRQLLETFFHHGEHAQVANVLHYMKAYLLDAMKAWETAQELPSPKEDFCDFAWMILNTMYSYDKSDFADLSFAFGKHLLTKRAFDEAKEFFENAKAQGADEAECLLYTLYAAMKITGESEFVSCERFSMNMPEYINLIVAIGDNDTLLQKVTTLAEENVKARTKPQKQPEREKQSDKQVQRRPLNKEKVKKALVFGGPFAFAVITLILIFAWIIPSVRPQGLIFDISDDGEYAIVTSYRGDASELLIPEKYSGLPVKKIAERAFSKCTNLTSITIPTSVQKVDDYAFYNCSNLQTVTFGANSQLSSIGSSAFENCTSLTSIHIPSSVQEVDGYAFWNCSQLQTVTFGENSQLSSIGVEAFYSCTSLTSIKYRGTEEQWNAITKGSNWNAYAGYYTMIYNYTGE